MGSVINAKTIDFTSRLAPTVEAWGHRTLKEVNYYKFASRKSYNALTREFDQALGTKGNWVGFGTLKDIDRIPGSVNLIV